MKKIIVLNLLLSLFYLNLSAHAASEAKIQALQGDVQISTKEGVSSEPTRIGAVISPSNVITTGPHSYCVVELDQNNIFRIKQNAQVKIEKLWEESQASDGSVVKEVRLNLLKGELNAKLKKLPPKSKFDVTGPVAIAGAAGTSYNVLVDPDKQKTSVTVLDHEVRVQSINEPDKFIQIQKFQRVDAVPWPSASLTAIGRGVLSETILGKDFVQEAEQNIYIQAIGTGKTSDEAKTQSLYRLSKTILQLRVDQEKNLEMVMAQNQDLTQKVYQGIAQAQIFESTQTPDGNFQVKTQISLTDLNQALGSSLYGMTQSVSPISLAEYSSKFGALARVTTQRAAQVEGYRNLAEIIYGTVIDSNTTIEDFAVKDDTVRTTIQGLVKGAQVVETQYFSDGSVITILEIRGDVIPESLNSVTGNIYGQNYLSGPRLLEFSSFEDYLELETPKNMVRDEKETAKETAREARQFAKDTARYAREKTRESRDETRDTVQEVRDTVQDTVDDVKDTAGDITND